MLNSSYNTLTGQYLAEDEIGLNPFWSSLINMSLNDYTEHKCHTQHKEFIRLNYYLYELRDQATGS